MPTRLKTPQVIGSQAWNTVNAKGNLPAGAEQPIVLQAAATGGGGLLFVPK